MSGLSLEDLKHQRREIETIQQKVGPRPHLLWASEVEILSDGRLDYPDRILADLDLVIASVHTSLGQPREKITARVLAALRNPHVDVLGHPTGRLLGQREAADLDLEAILRQAAELQVAVEIDSQPDRLDLNDLHAQRAAELGCLVAVNTDAHHPDHFAFRRYGLGLARRAWLSPAAVLNTWPIGDLESWLARRG
jgi:DNA polymerase (family 10)